MPDISSILQSLQGNFGGAAGAPNGGFIKGPFSQGGSWGSQSTSTGQGGGGGSMNGDDWLKLGVQMIPQLLAFL